MSLKPGIGAAWLSRYVSDVYPNDYVIVRGRKTKPPRYYDKLFRVSGADFIDDVFFAREDVAQLHLDNNTPERLAVRERLALARLSKLKRVLT